MVWLTRKEFLHYFHAGSFFFFTQRKHHQNKVLTFSFTSSVFLCFCSESKLLKEKKASLSYSYFKLREGKPFFSHTRPSSFNQQGIIVVQHVSLRRPWPGNACEKIWHGWSLCGICTQLCCTLSKVLLLWRQENHMTSTRHSQRCRKA